MGYEVNANSRGPAVDQGVGKRQPYPVIGSLEPSQRIAYVFKVTALAFLKTGERHRQSGETIGHECNSGH